MNTKKLVAGCTAALVLAGNVLGVSVQAQADVLQRVSLINADDSVRAVTAGNLADSDNGYRDQGTAQISEKPVQTDFFQVDDFEEHAVRIAAKAADASYSLADSEWADSGSDYYFSRLNTAEKKLYIALKKQADSYLTGTENFETTEVKRGEQKVQVYILPLVSYDGLTVEQMKKVFSCFKFENPQYYFMRNSVAYSENAKMVAVGLYEIFADGAKRAEYTGQLVQQLAVWEEQIASLEKTTEKEQRIHEIVCAHVSYNDAMTVDDPDDRQMSQSCISAVLFDHAAVCTGYAQLFSLLCNRADIPCVTVTSESHAWNRVQMGGTWYNTDCTWNDGKGDLSYLNVTDEQIQAEDSEKGEHVLSSEWEDLAPACTDAFDQEKADSGDNAADHVAAPGPITEIDASSQKAKLLVQFGPEDGCDGYMVQYSLNAGMEQSNKKNVEKASCTITGLKDGKTYYVRVRAYNLDRNGNKVYGEYSNKVKVIIKQ